jgi:hypothetical protein
MLSADDRARLSESHSLFRSPTVRHDIAGMFLILCVALLGSRGLAAQTASERESQFEIPITYKTLGPSSAPPAVGTSLVIADLKTADKQVSTILLFALQSLGYSIESPKLDPNTFLQPDQDWQTSAVDLTDSVVKSYQTASGSTLPSGNVYAVRYSGKYVFDPGVLKMVLTISLMERSQLGRLHDVNFQFSRQFFVARLEDAVKAQLANQ